MEDNEFSREPLLDGSRTSRVKLKVFVDKTDTSKSEKGRRSLLKAKSVCKKIYRAPRSLSIPVNTNTMNYKGSFFTLGDIVSVIDPDENVYYAQIRGFLEDQYCLRSVVITWLIPTQSSPRDRFDADTYIVGYEWEVPITLDCIEFVSHCPDNHLKVIRSDVPIKPVCGYLKTKNGFKIVNLPYNEESDSD